jgi:tetratricopeptide (TPR) repeat protein
MITQRLLKLIFYLGIILAITAILTWLFTRNWTYLVPSVWHVVLLVIGFLLMGLRFLLPIIMNLREKPTTDQIEPIIYPVSITDLLRPLGRGAKVNYLDRQIINSETLTRFRRLVITGESGAGKTRTAIELIRQLILENMIEEKGVYALNPAFQYLYRAEIKNAIQKAQSNHPIQLLFLDNLSGQVSDIALDLLSDLLTACEPALIIATNRSEDLWEPLRQWLEKESFYENPLPKLTSEQVRRFIDLAGGAYSLQLSPVACDVLAGNLEPTPGRLLVAFGRLANRESTYLTPDLVLPHTLGNLSDSFFSERAHLTKNFPGNQFLLEALAHFRTAHMPLYLPLILQFAEFLWKKSKPHSWFAIFSTKHFSLQKAANYFSAIDITVKDQVFESSQLVLDGLSNPQTAYLELSNFVKQIVSPNTRWNPNFFNQRQSQKAWMCFLLGSAFEIKNEFEIANLLISEALRIRPHAWFFSHRSRINSNLNWIDAAVMDANQAIKYDPNSAPAYTIRANYLLQKNEFILAIEDFSKAIEIDPKDSQAWLNRGNAYFAQEDLEKAIDDYDTALKLVPGLPAAVLARAKAYNIRGQLDQAIADYDQALVHNPEDTTLIYNRASAYDSVGDYARAIAEYDKLIALNPRDAQAYYNRGKDNHMLGNLEQAVLDYEQAILSNPKSAIAYRNRANALIRLNRLMEAKSDCREAERLEPNHPFTHARWGQYFAAREDYIGAIEKYELAAKLIGNPTHFNLDIAFCLISSGNSTAGLTKIKERLKKGINKEEALEALRDYEAQQIKQQSAGFHEAIVLLQEASK